MNPFVILGRLIMLIYDLIMLPFVILWKIAKGLAFFAFVIVVSLIVWGVFFR